MGLTPTKNAIIGTFINGRNAQDDFLQLATNNGDSVFAWIDAQGILQGTFANVVVPGGPTHAVQYNNAGALGGDSGFEYDPTGHRVVLSAATGLVFGGETSSNAGLFITGGTTVAARLADNSADAPVSASALSISGVGLTATVPVTITQLGTGPTNVTGAALFITDGGTPGVGTYFQTAGNTFRIRNDNLLITTHGSLAWDSSGLAMDGGASSPGFRLNTGASSIPGVGAGSATVTINATSGGPHVFAVAADSGSGDVGKILIDPFNGNIIMYGDVSGIGQIGVATAAGSPNKINIPLTTAAAAGMFLVSDGGNPQQTSWSNVIPFVTAPSTATSTGTTGQVAFDSTHLYVCISTNVWVRGTLATF